MSPLKDIKVGICQLTSVDSLTENINSILPLLQEATARGCEVVFLPENCLYMRVVEGEAISGMDLNDKVFKDLAAEAAKSNLAIHLGSVPLRLEGQLFNSSVFISNTGEVSSSYQKIHLFDIELLGQMPIRESDVFAHGKAPKILEFGGWRWGQSICYDLRFAELYSYYAKKVVDAILVPSAFLVKTGMAHWETLLRARAIESQCYVLAAAQAGTHHSVKTKAMRETYGRSMIVDPWGKIVVVGEGQGSQLLVAELQRQKTEDVRRQIPMSNHRKL